LKFPSEIGGFRVVSIRDLTIGYDSSTSNNEPTLPVSTSSQMITFALENQCLITLRTSGTEPKIKYYTEYKGCNFSQGTETLGKIVKEMIDLLLEPSLNKIK
jgi:phosphomannomutase